MFEVSPELLVSSDTRVRCGECFVIFDALANLLAPGETDAVGSDSAPPSDEGDDESSSAGARGTDAPVEADDVLSRPVEDAGAYAEEDAFDVTYSDFDLFSSEADLPEVAYPDESADTATFELDAVVDPEPEPESGAGESEAESGSGSDRRPGQGGRERSVDDLEPASPDAAAAPAPSFDSAASASRPSPGTAATASEAYATDSPPPFVAPGATVPLAAFDDPIERPPTRSGTWAIRSLMALVLVALLAGLYLYRERERLHNDPLGRPLLTLACAISGCQVPSRVDLAALTLLGKEVFTHPSVEGALVINVAFRNTAEFAQRYPLLIVRLRDRIGRSVAELDFPPAAYLDDWSPGDTLATGRTLDITLEVDDPGDGAESYEFEFREADA